MTSSSDAIYRVTLKATPGGFLEDPDGNTILGAVVTAWVAAADSLSARCEAVDELCDGDWRPFAMLDAKPIDRSEVEPVDLAYFEEAVSRGISIVLHCWTDDSPEPVLEIERARRMHKVILEARPELPIEDDQGELIGGAAVVGWMVRASLDDAVADAREHVESDGWRVTRLMEAFEVTRTDVASSDIKHYEQALLDWEVFVFRMLPASAPDDGESPV